jgi:uncharacterized protein
MIFRSILPLLILLLSSYRMPAQQVLNINPPLVTVTGDAFVKVKPDMVLLRIKVERSLPLTSLLSAGTPFNLFSMEETQLNFIGVNKEDITEAILQTRNKGGSSASQVAFIREIYVTVRNVARYYDVLLRIYSLGFTDISTVDYRSSRLGDLREEARKRAVEAAKQRASSMTAALGQTIGKAHYAEELYSAVYNPYTMDEPTLISSLAREQLSGDYYYEPGYITVVSRVKVSFDLQK